MNVMLIGLGPHAKRIYLKLIKKYNLNLKYIVDLKSEEQKIKEYLKSINMGNINIYTVDSKNKDLLELASDVKNDLKKILVNNNITHAIISTEPKAHFAYAKFLLENNINILMDKPITSPINVINSIDNVKNITKEYDILVDLYKKAKLKNPSIHFNIQCQRRFHKGYTYIYNLLDSIVRKYNIPITYIDIYHNDGMWNMPDEFIFRENHPYKYGYGKLFHSGYHFIDLMMYFLEINKNLKNKDINKAKVYATSYRPKDFIYNFNTEDYHNILKTDKFKEIDPNLYDGYGEIDVHSMINFYHDDYLVTNCSLNLMQSGYSRRSWDTLPIDTYKGNGRVRHERVNIEVGPLLNIQVHSYQAYEIKERLLHNKGKVGDIEHFDIYIFRNIDLIGDNPVEVIKLNELEKENDADFMGYNEKAREICFKEFLSNANSISDLLRHKESIVITEKIYEALVKDGNSMNFDFKLNDNKEHIVCIRDEDFNLKSIDNKENPQVRYGARGIVKNNDGKIALIYKEAKNEYKLPGGGIEELENPEESFKRECMEELGCTIKIENELGTALEDKSQENFKQLSYVFEGSVLKNLNKTNLTKKEKDEGTTYQFMNIDEALSKMYDSLNNLKGSTYDNLYRTRFVVLRDIKILEYYLNNNVIKHEMKLQDKPFNSIKSGSKKIEIRLNDFKRQLLKTNDLIEFSNMDTKEKILTKVIKLHKFNNFKELYNHFPKSNLGYKKEEVTSFTDMEKYYSKEENKYGVLGIEIELIKK